MSNHNGVSIGHVMTGTILNPTHVLKWGESIPPNKKSAMQAGETAILNDTEGKPYSIVLVDAFGTIREKRLESGGKFRHGNQN